MSNTICFNSVSLHYKNHVALKDLSFTLEDKKIYGLIGRNGAGKTSLLSLLASLRKATAGTITIDGAEFWENTELMQKIAFVHEKNYKDENRKTKKYIDFNGRYSASFDRAYADYLIGSFRLPLDKPVNRLSKGMRSTMDVIIGLSLRKPITIFDESYLGMDAPTRNIFYKELLADQERHPRIFILSTHLVTEMDHLFDQVLILHQGGLLLKDEYEALISKGLTVTGSADMVDSFSKCKRIIGTQQLGNTKAVTLYEENNQEVRQEAQQKGLNVGNISLQDLFIHLTEEEPE